jgi:hypothetical protein
MTTQSIDSMHEKSSTISSCLQSVPLSSIRNILPDKAIIEACRQAGYEYRDRLLTPIVTPQRMDAFGTQTGYKDTSRYPPARMVVMSLAN